MMTPLCRRCGEPATARLIYVWDEDNTEAGRSDLKCQRCYERAVVLWDRLSATAPEATAGLRVLVGAP
jgi:hypothetical protein